MLEAKIAGTRHLADLTRDRRLDFFVLFSSTAAWGAAGLGHYAAANQYLDAFAHASRQKGLPVTSINWGAWEGLRLEHEGDEERYAEIGLNFMPSERALALMGELIAGGAANRAVASIDWSRLKSVFEARRHRPFFDRIDVSRRDDRSEAAPAAATIAQVLEAEPEDRHDRLTSLVGAEVARVLKLGPGKRLDHNQGLFEMGMDSLMSVELKGRLESLMDRSLPSTLTFNYPSVAALTGYLETLLPGAPITTRREPPRRAVEGKPARKSPEAPRPQLSEDDLEKLLADRLQRIR
jgi:myxalamid-type polyketide synthase MxaE and MxaD